MLVGKLGFFRTTDHLPVPWSAQATSISSFREHQLCRESRAALAGGFPNAATHTLTCSRKAVVTILSLEFVSSDHWQKGQARQHKILLPGLCVRQSFSKYTFLLADQHTGKQHERENPENPSGWEVDKLPPCLTLREAALFAMNSCPQ